MSLLEVKNVSKFFGGVRAVDRVSFVIGAGEFVGLIGPNGAGKSTLFSVIAGAESASAGSVRFAGHDITGVAAHSLARRGLARTFQTAAAFGSMTVRQNVQLALTVRAGVRSPLAAPLWRFYSDEADALLGRVGLQQAAEQAAAGLAYPDVKRLELAIALAGRPRLLLMDEPTAGMAPAERFALMDLVAALIDDSGLTVLFTEHSMEVVFGYARRLLVLSHGVLIADGEPEGVRADPQVRAAYFGDGGRA